MNFPPSIEATTPVWAVFKLIVERAVVTEDAESDISTPLILISLAEISATDILKETVTVTFTDNDATERKIYNLDEIKVGKDGKTR